jgi:hypothetical protein
MLHPGKIHRIVLQNGFRWVIAPIYMAAQNGAAGWTRTDNGESPVLLLWGSALVGTNFLILFGVLWCGWSDSNRQRGNPQRILSPPRMPISPQPHRCIRGKIRIPCTQEGVLGNEALGRVTACGRVGNGGTIAVPKKPQGTVTGALRICLGSQVPSVISSYKPHKISALSICQPRDFCHSPL